MGCNFRNAGNGKSQLQVSGWPRLRPWHWRMRFYDSFYYYYLFKKLRRFVWKKLLKSKTVLSHNIFHRYPLNVPKIQLQTDI